MYGCDCDGIKREPADAGAEGVALRATLRVVEQLTGHRPPTCPWRAMYEPIVRDVLAVSWASPNGNLAAAIGRDPYQKTVDALGVYLRALDATRGEDMRLDAEERDRKRAHSAAARKAGGRG